MELSYLDERAAQLRERISAAAAAAGRRADDVTLLVAVKYTDAATINYLHRHCGINDIGENRVQQLLEHWDGLEHEGLNVHFIGSLQTNKVKYIVDKVCMIHSLDSLRLANEINARCAAAGRVMDVLIEINSGREASKGGVMPEDAEALAAAVTALPAIRLRGFMTMAPKFESDEKYDKYFQETYKLILDIWHKKLHNIERPVISMGMSGSFESAVRHGSTCVRVGRALLSPPEQG